MKKNHINKEAWEAWTAGSVLNGIEKEFKTVAKQKPEVKKSLKRILRSIALIRNLISKKNAEDTFLTTRFLDYLIYETGYFKPFYLIWGSTKGGSVSKKKKGILLAIEQIMPKLRKTSPSYGWRFFQREHGDSYKQFAVKDSEYELYFDTKDNLLVQIDGDGNESSIRFKTFQRYFSEVLKLHPELKR